jgi:hypothetical protein
MPGSISKEGHCNIHFMLHWSGNLVRLITIIPPPSSRFLIAIYQSYKVDFE